MYGVIGEVQALFALYFQRHFGQPNGPLICAIFLTAIAAGGPAVALINAAADMYRLQISEVERADAAALHAPGPEPGETAEGTESGPRHEAGPGAPAAS
jgi:hypothetical protein